MSVWHPGVTAEFSQRGGSLVELMVAMVIGLSLLALFGHTVTTFQVDYRRSVTRIDGDQQAHLALALLADELDALVHVLPSATTCPAAGVRVDAGRVEFAANLYDRVSRLVEPAVSGRQAVVVEAGKEFKTGDLVMLIDVVNPDDPGDDRAECLRIADKETEGWILERPLQEAFPAGSPVALVNRVVYARDRQGRLMRTQDSGTQRVAQDVQVFDTRRDGASLVVSLAVRGASTWTRRMALTDIP